MVKGIVERAGQGGDGERAGTTPVFALLNLPHDVTVLVVPAL